MTTRTWVLVLASIASLMVALDTLVVSTALSTIRTDLDASIAELEWTVNAYNLSFAVLLLTAAALGDRYGRRALFAAGLGIFTVASAACALAPDVGTLIAARALQGVGAALVMPLGLALVSAAFPPERRGSALGILSGLTGLAVGAGPVIGGAIADGLAWQWIFWVNVPIGLATIPFVFLRMRESHGPDTAVDIRGLLLATGGAFGLVWGLVRGNAAGWVGAEVLTSLLGGAILVALFVAWELRAKAPMLPPRLFKARTFAASNAAIFCAVGSLFAAVFFFAQFLQTGMGYGPLDAGLRLVTWTATLFFVAPIAGMLVDRIGARPLLAGGLTLHAAGLTWIALIADPGMSYAALIAPFIVSGAGISMVFPAAQTAAMEAADADTVGKAAGTNSMMRELGGVFGIAICVAVFAGAGGYASPAEFSDGFTPAMLVAAAIAAVGAVIGSLVSPRVAPAAAPIAAEARA
ncbi:MAG TPA: MFS transporter [Solirubrobacteraceae bacterium]